LSWNNGDGGSCVGGAIEQQREPGGFTGEEIVGMRDGEQLDAFSCGGENVCRRSAGGDDGFDASGALLGAKPFFAGRVELFQLFPAAAPAPGLTVFSPAGEQHVANLLDLVSAFGCQLKVKGGANLAFIAVVLGHLRTIRADGGNPVEAHGVVVGKKQIVGDRGVHGDPLIDARQDGARRHDPCAVGGKDPGQDEKKRANGGEVTDESV